MKEDKKRTIRSPLMIAVVIVLTSFFFSWPDPLLAAEKPRHGGILTYAISDAPPSYDGHRESTFALIHAISPFYSLLLKFDQDAYPKIVGDLAESWSISKDYKTYTFKIHKGVKFHDGSLLKAGDVKASYEKIAFPGAEIVSTRKAFYSVINKIEAPDDQTIIFRLNRPSASFLSSLASPWNYIYKADILAKDPRWYEKNIMGTGPFKFAEFVPGSHLVGKRNEDYFMKGRPYLDGFRAIFIKDTGARVAALRSGRVHAEFRFFGPTHRDEVVKALGDKIRVHETPITTGQMVLFHNDKKPFNDPRFRRALSLAIDRWEGSKVLSSIANLKEVGGVLRPGASFAMTKEELTKLPGYSTDIEASRKEARRLLKEIGIPEGFSFVLKNRPPAKDYETIAIWLIDQWRQVGLNATQKVQELGSFFADIRSGNFDMIINSISDYMDEPDLQFINFLSFDKSERNYGRYTDRVLDDLYVKQSQTMNHDERKKLCDQFQTRILDEKTYVITVPWIHRIVLHSSKMKGWKALPSHFLNQDLRDVWLEAD